MTRTVNLALDHVDTQIWAVLKPSRIQNDFVDYDIPNATYVADFDFGGGNIIDISQDGVSLTEGTLVLSSGEYYQDLTNNKIYIRSIADANPNNVTTVITWEIYVASLGGQFYRDPTDDTTRVVDFNPWITQSPQLKGDLDQANRGFFPVQSSTITIDNSEHFFEAIVYDASFNDKDIDVYHLVTEKERDLETTDFKLLMTAKMSDVTYRDGNVSISINSRENEFLKEFRPETDDFYNTTTWPNVDPNFIGAPVRYVYGKVDGFTPVNVDFVSDSPTTSDNRDWAVRTDKTELHDITLTVDSGSTTSRIELTTAPTGLQVGDQIWVDKATDEYVEVEALGADYIDVTPTMSVAPLASDTVKRGTIGRIVIVQEGVKYYPRYNRDYTINTSLGGDVVGFTFNNSLESSLSIPNTLSPNDRVFCRVYGKQNNVTLGGSPLGSDDTDTGNLTAPAPIIFDIFKRFLGLAESGLNTASFTALQSATTESLSFAIPRNAQDEFPTFQDLFQDLVKSLLLRVYLGGDNKWAVAQYEPISTSDETVEDIDIIADSISYSLNYRDLSSDVLLKYNYQENDENLANNNEKYDIVTSSSDTAKYLHGVNKTETIESLHLKSSDAQNLADHFAFVYGDRQGRFRLRVTRVLFDVEISDKISITRDKLPGFAYVKDTDQTRLFSLIGFEKSLNGVNLILDDQKGADDNSSSW